VRECADAPLRPRRQFVAAGRVHAERAIPQALLQNAAGFVVLSVPTLTYESWYRLFLSPFMRVATLLAMLALIYHAWIGLRDVVMDYFPKTWMRLSLQIITLTLLAGYACWTVIILWSV